MKLAVTGSPGGRGVGLEELLGKRWLEQAWLGRLTMKHLGRRWLQQAATEVDIEGLMMKLLGSRKAWMCSCSKKFVGVSPGKSPQRVKVQLQQKSLVRRRGLVV